jgi:hypothetical protein
MNLGVHLEFIAPGYPAPQRDDPLRVVATMKGGQFIVCDSVLRSLGVRCKVVACLARLEREEPLEPRR